jgi:hypothetical protein
LKFWRRWLIGLGAVAILAPLARPAWDILTFIFVDPYSDHGAVSFSFRNDRPEEVRIVALRLAESVRFTEDTSGGGYTVDRPSRQGTMSSAMMSALAGRQPAEIRYRIGDEGEVRVFRFEVDLLEQHLCDVLVRFGEDGPSASACANHHPGTYGGTWPH